MVELSEIIIQEIRDNGPIPFREFMEMCLYYPELGYYTSTHNPIGQNGDFYTSAYLTPVFGALIGRQLEKMWRILGSSAFTIVEYGAGTGMLCHDILLYIQSNKPMYDQLRYFIIEKSPTMRAIEKKHLREKVFWVDSIEEISGINGCIFSNELLDNFAVHQVVMNEELMEVFVDYQDGFTEVLLPAKEALNMYCSELGVELPKGFRTEINLQAISWIKEVAASLKEGFVMTIDYGDLSTELYRTNRSQGTLLCYHNHCVSDCIYENIGIQDITAHVNFSALSHWGSKNGLKDCCFTDQCHFLLGLGFKEYINQALSHEKDIIQAARKASIISHRLLLDMGHKFKVLVQGKGLNFQNLASAVKA